MKFYGHKDLRIGIEANSREEAMDVWRDINIHDLQRPISLMDTVSVEVLNDDEDILREEK